MNFIEKLKERAVRRDLQGLAIENTFEDIVKKSVIETQGCFNLVTVEAVIGFITATPARTAKCQKTKMACLTILKKFRYDFLRKAHITVARAPKNR